MPLAEPVELRGRVTPTEVFSLSPQLWRETSVSVDAFVDLESPGETDSDRTDDDLVPEDSPEESPEESEGVRAVDTDGIEGDAGEPVPDDLSRLPEPSPEPSP